MHLSAIATMLPPVESYWFSKLGYSRGFEFKLIPFFLHCFIGSRFIVIIGLFNK